MKTEFNYLSAMSFNLEDYKSMFGLSSVELDMHIVNCYAGASLFAKEMADLGRRCVSSDPLYRLPLQDIKKTIEKAQQLLNEKVTMHPELFSLKRMHNFDIINQKGIECLIEDLSHGIKAGRYTQEASPFLGFKDEQFDLALVNHYLFTENEQSSAEFHANAILEFIRIAPEVRLYPLVTKDSHLSSHIGEVAALLQVKGYGVEIRGVPFEFQTHGNAMMRIWSPSCDVAKHRQFQQ